MSVLDALADPQLLGAQFNAASWSAWRAVLGALDGLPLSGEALASFTALANRNPPASPVRELFVVAGRRSGKTHVVAALGVYVAGIGAELSGTLAKLSPGERGIVALIACDRAQARVLLGYVRALLYGSPILSPLVERDGAESIDLRNGVSIEVFTNNFRSVRGRTLLFAALDEMAFYRSELTANPDVETYRALTPALATTGGLLVGISSPYAKRGLLFDKYRKHYGKDGDVLVVQGATESFNPTIDQRVIQSAKDDDPEAANAEWGGQFRTDVESFIRRETVADAMRAGQLELPFNRKNRYLAFADPSGGGADGFCLAIGHLEGERVVLDVVRERKRMAPAAVVAEYAALLRRYCIAEVTGDKYAGSWPEQEFARHGIRYTSAARPKSELYLDALAALNSERVELPPDETLLTQFSSLERRTGRGGRDSIDHAPGSHDDRANVVAGLIAVVTESPRKIAMVW